MTGPTMIQRAPTAFASTKDKRPRKQDKPHLEFIRSLPSLINGLRPVDAAHVRYASHAYGKRETGASEKPDDKWTLPLTRQLHEAQHAFGDERAWWEQYGLDPLAICLALATCDGNEEVGELIIREANARAQQHVAGRPIGRER